MKQSKIEKNDKGESFRKKINLQELLQIDDEELQAFAQRLTIHITKEYELHKIQTIKDLGQHLDITPDESTNFYYPSAFSLIAHKAGSNEESNRKITKKQFVDYLKTAKEVVYSRWNRKEVGEERFHRDLRNRYFSATNIDNNDRYFIIEVVQSDSLAQIFYVIMEIRKKWSSHSIKRKPNSERYAPYIFLKGITPGNLISIKTELFSKKIKFTDGYPFLGSSLNVDCLMREQTLENAISIRLVSDLGTLESTLSRSRNQSIIYDFYKSIPSNIHNEFTRKISIPIQEIEEVSEII